MEQTPEKIRAQCPTCGTKGSVPTDKINNPIRCPKCDQLGRFTTKAPVAKEPSDELDTDEMAPVSTQTGSESSDKIVSLASMVEAQENLATAQLVPKSPSAGARLISAGKGLHIALTLCFVGWIGFGVLDKANEERVRAASRISSIYKYTPTPANNMTDYFVTFIAFFSAIAFGSALKGAGHWMDTREELK